MAVLPLVLSAWHPRSKIPSKSSPLALFTLRRLTTRATTVRLLHASGASNSLVCKAVRARSKAWDAASSLRLPMVQSVRVLVSIIPWNGVTWPLYEHQQETHSVEGRGGVGRVGLQCVLSLVWKTIDNQGAWHKHCDRWSCDLTLPRCHTGDELCAISRGQKIVSRNPLWSWRLAYECDSRLTTHSHDGAHRNKHRGTRTEACTFGSRNTRQVCLCYVGKQCKALWQTLTRSATNGENRRDELKRWWPDVVFVKNMGIVYDFSNCDLTCPHWCRCVLAEPVRLHRRVRRYAEGSRGASGLTVGRNEDFSWIWKRGGYTNVRQSIQNRSSLWGRRIFGILDGFCFLWHMNTLVRFRNMHEKK